MLTTEEQFDQHLQQFSSMPGARVVVSHVFRHYDFQRKLVENGEHYSTQIYPCSPSTKHPVGDVAGFHSPERMFKYHCSTNKNPGIPCQVRLETYNSVTSKWELVKKETYEPKTNE
jgi:hypothetical protein